MGYLHQTASRSPQRGQDLARIGSRVKTGPGEIQHDFGGGGDPFVIDVHAESSTNLRDIVAHLLQRAHPRSGQVVSVHHRLLKSARGTLSATAIRLFRILVQGQLRT